MNNPELTTFLLEQIGQQPIEQRITLYRLLSLETSDTKVRDACRTLADELEAIALRHEQLVLDFRRRTAS